ncbi:hypothetical protein GGQ21_003084 [Salinibacter ruber]|uniref:putative capsular polysaccharide synthesis family protein n=1 Tax=Salinibacter ruber TaxID=146919 RepID=UPI00216977DD|nr:putative capsular polysaccharide synthesis family protein [Salinibacter ruber]MCS3672414.1 hypothetical protein [Salinibacter ruber]
MVRDPIAYNISRFFALAPLYNPVSESDWPEAAETLGSVDTLISRFLQRFDHDFILRWFDSWKSAPGIDVFNQYFPESGIDSFGNTNTQVLIFRAELEDDVKAKAVSNFLGVGTFAISRTNSGITKPYGGIYEQFKSEFIAPKWYTDKMYNNAFFRHFYTDYHRKKFVKKWT